MKNSSEFSKSLLQSSGSMARKKSQDLSKTISGKVVSANSNGSNNSKPSSSNLTDKIKAEFTSFIKAKIENKYKSQLEEKARIVAKLEEKTRKLESHLKILQDEQIVKEREHLQSKENNEKEKAITVSYLNKEAISLKIQLEGVTKEKLTLKEEKDYYKRKYDEMIKWSTRKDNIIEMLLAFFNNIQVYFKVNFGYEYCDITTLKTLLVSFDLHSFEEKLLILESFLCNQSRKWAKEEDLYMRPKLNNRSIINIVKKNENEVDCDRSFGQLNEEDSFRRKINNRKQIKMASSMLEGENSRAHDALETREPNYNNNEAKPLFRRDYKRYKNMSMDQLSLKALNNMSNSHRNNTNVIAHDKEDFATTQRKNDIKDLIKQDTNLDFMLTNKRLARLREKVQKDKDYNDSIIKKPQNPILIEKEKSDQIESFTNRNHSIDNVGRVSEREGEEYKSLRMRVSALEEELFEFKLMKSGEKGTKISKLQKHNSTGNIEITDNVKRANFGFSNDQDNNSLYNKGNVYQSSPIKKDNYLQRDKKTHSSPRKCDLHIKHECEIHNEEYYYGPMLHYN